MCGRCVRCESGIAPREPEPGTGRLVGKPTETPRTVMMGAGWVINVAVAEWIIRRRGARAGGGASRVSPEPSPSAG